MSLADFQRAMADLAGSPELCRLAKTDPDEVLHVYALTDRERARLVSVVGQPGMQVNCTIHRTTRMIALDTLLPLTCAALGEALGTELDAYWKSCARPAIRFDTEAARFVAHLESRVEHGRGAWPCSAAALADLARLELSMETLRISPGNDVGNVDGDMSPPSAAPRSRLHPDARVVRLDHDPAALLAVGTGAGPQRLGSVPRRSCLVVLTREGDRIDVFAVPADRVDDVEALVLGQACADWLLKSGLAISGGRPRDQASSSRTIRS
jgi:hypothetical protein